MIPLALNTVASLLLTSWGLTIRNASQEWISADPTASVSDVHWVGLNATIDVVTDDGEIPDTGDLAAALDELPEFVGVSVRVQTEAEYSIR